MYSAKPIQIIKPIDHTFYLESNHFKSILASEDLRDRHVVIVSIAGDLRKGKSFLLNFFLKYLYAQYKRHDVSDWIGENSHSNAEMDGFEFRGGQKPATLGIWMWSEIFTHDFKNGEKVAIILMDTQGIFDNESTMKDCTTIFSISMMMSSVQCYNIMQKVQENDLQNLHLFTEYGELAMELNSMNEKPFQKLLFIVRDWPYEYESNGYGYSKEIVEKLLAEKEKQAFEMRILRKRLKSSFDVIEAFLMPHPGLIVQTEQFKGNLHQLDRDFVECVKNLVPSLLSPENLVVKEINGQKLKVRDLLTHLQMYVDVFNRQELPTPESLAMATAKANILPVLNDCLKFYLDSMQTAFDNVQSSYFSEIDLEKIHFNTKDSVLVKYQENRKFGGKEFVRMYQDELEVSIDNHYLTFCMKNDQMRNQNSKIKYWYNASCMAGGVAGLGAGVAVILAPYAAGVAVLSLIRSISK